MRKVLFLILSLVFILGMSRTGMALDNGTYDFYGTLYMDGHAADGGTQECALTVNGLSCPSSTDFCIKNLDVTGNVVTSNDGGPHYGIAVGILKGTVQDIDFDGVGAVSLTVDATGNVDTLQTMVVGDDGGGGSCSGGEVGAAAVCVTSLNAGMQSGTAGSGTVTGEIPVTFVGEPTTYPSCTGGLGVYPGANVTTETAEVNISNENGQNQTRSESGSRLSGLDMTLAESKPVFRTTILGVPIGTDAFAAVIWEGTLCKRTSPTVSCIPGGVTCPAEDD
jgi:hypothetical protein